MTDLNIKQFCFVHSDFIYDSRDETLIGPPFIRKKKQIIAYINCFKREIITYL